jgi:hypothetical protein
MLRKHFDADRGTRATVSEKQSRQVQSHAANISIGGAFF